MPLYEYICDACGHRFTWLVGVVASSPPPTCDRCASTQAKRKEVSRFARIQAVGDDAGADDMDDPASMRRWAKEMGGELGEGLGEEFDEYIDSAESGEE